MKNFAIIKEKEVNEKVSLKLDYTLHTPEERLEYAKKLTEKEHLSPKNLEYLSDYVIEAIDKKERKQRKILTDNRLATINKRETSFEELISKLENGEDGIYSMLEQNRNIPLTPKIAITPKDLAEMPELVPIKQEIETLEKQLKTATGHRRYLLRKHLIEARQEQYTIKNSLKPLVFGRAGSNGTTPASSDLEDHVTVNPLTVLPANDSIVDIFNPKHISAILQNYSQLKQDSWGKFNSDIFYLMLDIDHLVDLALKDDYPFYYDLLIHKIDGKTNEEIQSLLLQQHGHTHTPEYISSLWRNKIPKLIADAAIDEYLIWYYTEVERGKWKRCSCCGQIKLAHNRFFSKNNTSRDGFYSLCKKCRNRRTKERKEQRERNGNETN